jgi:hypothetical protein
VDRGGVAADQNELDAFLGQEREQPLGVEVEGRRLVRRGEAVLGSLQLPPLSRGNPRPLSVQHVVMRVVILEPGSQLKIRGRKQASQQRQGGLLAVRFDPSDRGLRHSGEVGELALGQPPAQSGELHQVPASCWLAAARLGPISTALG